MSQPIFKKRAALVIVAAVSLAGGTTLDSSCSLDVELLTPHTIKLTHPPTPPAFHAVHGQSTNGESCVQVPFESIDSVSTNSPNIASLAKAAALQGAAQWYEPADHGTCDRLPLRDFQNSVEVISACYFDDSERPDLAVGIDRVTLNEQTHDISLALRPLASLSGFVQRDIHDLCCQLERHGPVQSGERGQVEGASWGRYCLHPRVPDELHGAGQYV